MSIKSLIAAALVVGSSSVALANPVVSSVAPARACAVAVLPARTAPVMDNRFWHGPVIDPLPLSRPTLVGTESRIFRGTETFWVGAQKGRFQTLKLETEGFKSFVTDVKIHF